MPPTRLGELHEFVNYRDLRLDGIVSLLMMMEVVDGADPYAAAAFWRDLRDKGEAEVSTKSRTVYLKIEDGGEPGIVDGYLFPHRQAGGADLGYVRFDGRGSVRP